MINHLCQEPVPDCIGMNPVSGQLLSHMAAGICQWGIEIQISPVAFAACLFEQEVERTNAVYSSEAS